MTTAALEKQLKSGELLPLYLFYGEQTYLTAHFARAAAARAGGTMPAFNLHRFDPDGFSLARLTAAVNNLPLMAQTSCVLLRDILPESFSQSEWKEFLALLEQAPENCVLVLAFADAPLETSKARARALLALAQKRGLAQAFDTPPRGELKKWLARRAKAAGASIAPDAAEALLDACGGDMARMETEIQKLAAFCAGDDIAPGAVEQMVAKDVESSIYDLARAVVAGRLAQSMALLDRLWEQKLEAVIILSALSQAFCDLYRAAVASAAGVQAARVADDFGYKGRAFRVRNAMRDCRGLSPVFLRAALVRLLAADGAVKSGANARLTLERLCIELCAMRKKAAG